MPPKAPQLNKTGNLSASSAFKSLEIVLFQLSRHLNVPVQKLLARSELYDNETRLTIATIKDTLNNLEYMLRTTLRERATIIDDDLTRADEQLLNRVQVDNVLRALATSTSITDHNEFYRFCVRTMAELYGCRFAFIGLLQEDRQHVRTLAVWAGDKFAENFEYSLIGTPCADILTFNKELIPTGASTLYPQDDILIHMGIDSYFGAPILHKDKGVMGLISVMDTEPMQPTEWTAPVLGVFAARLALELERQHSMDALAELNETLEARIRERTHSLEVVNEELKSFSYSVSHDLRAPIRAVKSFTDILIEDHGDELSANAKDIVNRIHKAGNRLDNIVQDLLRLSRISNAELLIQKVPISFMVRDILNALHETAPERVAQFNIEPGLTCWADESLLRIVLENLLGNAWKYTRDNELTTIEFGLNSTGANESFYIKDNGVGFDETFKHKLFVPFERLHSDVEFEGTGIGLATTLRAINRHQGKIWAESSPGEGACFYFNLGYTKPIQ
jgi:signal transduction histidine kinase